VLDDEVLVQLLRSNGQCADHVRSARRRRAAERARRQFDHPADEPRRLRRRFGVVHERSFRLATDGRLLEGMDRFTGAASRRTSVFTVRFHLHHTVAVHATDRRTAFDFRLPDEVDLEIRGERAGGSGRRACSYPTYSAAA
jgi:hypothetical protein